MVNSTNDTDNHDWEYPADGYDADSPDWGDLLNTLIDDDLDRDVVIKDTHANRPAAGEADRWFLATDKKYVAYDDGNSWEIFAGTADAGTRPAGTTYRNGVNVADDIVDDQGNTIWDYAKQHIPATILQTIPLGSGTDADLDGTDLVDAAKTIWDTSVGALTQQVGTSSNRQDAYLGQADANSVNTDEIRVATGQSIEDGSGNGRLRVGAAETALLAEDETNLISLQSGTKTQIAGNSTTPIILRDNEGSYDAVKYVTDSSTGTLKLMNAELEFSDNNHEVRWPIADGSEQPRIATTGNNGEVYAIDDSGNQTTLT